MPDVCPPLALTWPYPRWIAHRGAGRLAPENTLAAFRLGASLGFRMFECDVTLSADDQPFLLHDPDLGRTTTGQGPACAQPWSVLSGLDAGSWHSEAHAGERLLHLDELASWLIAQGLQVNLEIKPAKGLEAHTGAVVAVRAAQLWAGQAVMPLLSSFQLEALQAARDAAPDLPRALLLARWPDEPVAQATALGCCAVVAQHECLDAPRIAALHAAGLKALTYTVNDPARAELLWAAGLDGLITDRVDLFRPEP